MTPEAAEAAALKLARGSYQRDIVLGRALLSGADIRGAAARYSSRYAGARRALFDRIVAARIPFSVTSGPSLAGGVIRLFQPYVNARQIVVLRAPGPSRVLWGSFEEICCTDPDHPDCRVSDELAYDCARFTRSRRDPAQRRRRRR